MKSKGKATIMLGKVKVPVELAVGTQKGDDEVKFERVSATTKKPFKQQYVDVGLLAPQHH